MCCLKSKCISETSIVQLKDAYKCIQENPIYIIFIVAYQGLRIEDSSEETNYFKDESDERFVCIYNMNYSHFESITSSLQYLVVVN